MQTSHFRATLTSEVIFSERSSTLGGHTTLPFIPGSALLGWCAGRLYGKLGTDAFKVFHSGAVRFGNAYPLDDAGGKTYPCPLSWHKEKNISLTEGNRLVAENIWNLLYLTDDIEKGWRANNAQPKQVREGFFSLNGSFVDPLSTSTYRLKTAIERDRGGRPRDKQLFGYESLSAGSKWYFPVHFADDLAPNIKDNICQTLTERRLRLGKSRMSEYGGNIDITPDTSFSENFKPQSFENENYLVFYSLSDAAFRDEKTGAPTFAPAAEQLGLNAATLIPEKCFLRTRRYAPYNSKRKCWDLERHVICRGSVITFKVDSPPSESFLADVQKHLDNGVGLFQSDGLGSFLLNPGFLIKGGFNPAGLFRKDEEVKQRPNQSDPKTGSLKAVGLSPESRGLTEWLDLKDEEQKVEFDVSHSVKAWVDALASAIQEARGKAPGKAQWAQLRDIAVRAEDMNAIRDALFDEKKGLCTHGVSKKMWQERFFYAAAKRMLSYEDFMKEFVIQQPIKMENPAMLSFTRQALFRMANHLSRKLGKEDQQ